MSRPPLSETHPELASEADGWDPSTLTAGSNKRVAWICESRHEWVAAVYQRTSGRGCPFCSGNKIWIGFNDLATTHPEIASQSNGWDPKTVSAGSNYKKSWKCEFAHIWEAPTFSRVAGKGCPICDGKIVLAGFNDLNSKFPEIAQQAFGWDPSTVAPKSAHKKKWRCEFGHIWQAPISGRTNGNGCPVCSGRAVEVGFNDLLSKSPELAIEAHGWDPNTVTRASSQRKEWKCNLGHIWTSTPADRAAGYGCPFCSGNKVLAGFNDLLFVFPEIAAQAKGWDPSKISSGSNRKLKWECGLGHEWVASVSGRTTKHYGCPYCAGQMVLVGFNDLKTTFPFLSQEAFGWDPQSLSKGSGKKVAWKCEFGHIWKSTVTHRVGGRGCPTCAISGFDPNSKAWLYFLSHPDWQMLQIGITNFPDDRLKSHKKLGWKLLELRGPMDGHLTQQWETAMLRMLKAKGADLSNSGIVGKFDGYSEAWGKSTFPVKSIKELMRLTEEFEEGKK